MIEEASFIETATSPPCLSLALVAVFQLVYFTYFIIGDVVAWFRRLHRFAMRWKQAEMERRYYAWCRYLNEQQMPKARLIKKRRRLNEHPHRYDHT